ncbi:hypothetical protein ACU686_44120 [Yinghuangia aomiensis]
MDGVEYPAGQFRPSPDLGMTAATSIRCTRARRRAALQAATAARGRCCCAPRRTAAGHAAPDRSACRSVELSADTLAFLARWTAYGRAGIA